MVLTELVDQWFATLPGDTPTGLAVLSHLTDQVVLTARQRLHAQAQTLADAYHAERTLANAQCTASRQRLYIGVRARFSNNGFVVEWFRQQPSSTVDSATGRKRVFSQAIAKGPGPRYRPQAFSHCLPWQRDLINTYEDRFAQLRAQNAALVRLRLTLRNQLTALQRRAAVAADGKA